MLGNPSTRVPLEDTVGQTCSGITLESSSKVSSKLPQILSQREVIRLLQKTNMRSM